MSRGELIHFFLFIAVALIAYNRANLPDFKEKEVYMRGIVVGDIMNESGYTATRIRVEESEIEDIEGRKALLKVYGYLPPDIRRLSLLGNVSVKNNRVYVYAKSSDIEFLPLKKGLRETLMERYSNVSMDKSMVPLGLSFLFGEPRELLPSRVQRDFLSTGLVHLLVVSGLHVGMVALVLTKMLPRFWGMKLALSGVILYALFVVPHEPPVLRASFMFSIALLIYLSFYRPNMLAVLLFSGTVMLLLYPYYLFSYSFWLSFVATAYIILTLRELEAGSGVKTLLVSASAFTGVAPLVSTFSGVSPMSVLLTPLLTPVVILYSLLGVLSLMTLMSFPPFVDLFNLTGHLFGGIVRFASSLSLNLYPNIGFYEATFLVLFGLVSLHNLRGYSKTIPLIAINLWLLVRSV
ncbi:competence protein ComEC [Hydrogenivirga caldilitoris]|uniref:Competence protein ComEC n=1 Tax=Hydrogenivirga caldilitoris TaxID=246264 RepID=A0A497XQ73_9AQUI|nr:ComEC/Rec2 family competence protein [Hydrogenivirga caldilitoris]RLJ70431.1 competence protein ComEC [Hydrogenivirga caldilitoris]